MGDSGSAMSMTVAQLTTIMNSVTGTINITTMISYLAAIIGVAVVFALMWWGVRKALSVVFGSIRSGRVGS